MSGQASRTSAKTLATVVALESALQPAGPAFWRSRFAERETIIRRLTIRPARDCDLALEPTILRVLEDCPKELLGLQATLLQEHVWRQRKGL
jgi:hypothetical protein